MSVRGQHCIDHGPDTKQKSLMGPDCLLGVVPQPIGSRLSETSGVEGLKSASTSRSLGNQTNDQTFVKHILIKLKSAHID